MEREGLFEGVRSCTCGHVNNSGSGSGSSAQSESWFSPLPRERERERERERDLPGGTLHMAAAASDEQGRRNDHDEASEHR